MVDIANTPAAVLSYNRPDLLRRVLESIKAQSSPLDPAKVFLFQDGGSPEAPRCIDTFWQSFPEGRVFNSKENLGIALNFDRAERYIFEEIGADIGLFFEDDLVLGPNYLSAMIPLMDLALSNEKVAYVAAYGNHTSTADEQIQRSGELIPMGHKWGFALTKRQWLLQKPIVEPYLNIVRTRPYKSRDAAAIGQYYETLGYASTATSQDGMKIIASCVLGTVSIMPVACFARYEGETGEHFGPEIFEQMGFGKTSIFTGRPSFDTPTPDQVEKWAAQLRSENSLELTRARLTQQRARLVACMDKIASESEVITAYRLILGREPESESAVKSRANKFTLGQLRSSLLNSEEFVRNNGFLKEKFKQ